MLWEKARRLMKVGEGDGSKPCHLCGGRQGSSFPDILSDMSNTSTTKGTSWQENQSLFLVLGVEPKAPYMLSMQGNPTTNILTYISMRVIQNINSEDRPFA